MEDNFLLINLMVSYLLQCKLSVSFLFNVYSSFSGTLLGSKYEGDPPEDNLRPSVFLSAHFDPLENPS